MHVLRQLFRRSSVAALVFVFVCGLHAQSSAHLTLQDLLSLEPIGDYALSPDGKTIALTRAGQIFLLPSAGGWPVLLTSTQGGKSGLDWSPDSKQIAYASQGGIWVVSAPGGAPRRLTNAPPGGGDSRQATDRAPHWSPKGRWILFQSRTDSKRRRVDPNVVATSDGRAQSFSVRSSLNRAVERELCLTDRCNIALSKW